MKAPNRGLRFLPLILVCLAVTAFAKEKDKPTGDSLAEVTKQVKTAVAKGDVAAAKAAFARALQTRPRFKDKKLNSLVAAVGSGAKHKNTELALAAIETLGGMKVKGSSKQLAPLLSVPKKVDEERLEVHLAAIRATGQISDPDSAKSLDKLILSPNEKVAVAAAESMEGFAGGLDTKVTNKQLGQLATTLEKLEASEKKAKKDEDTARIATVKSALLKSVQKMAGSETIDSSAALRGWLKEQKKEKKS